MNKLILIAALALSGCSSMPKIGTVDYCDLQCSKEASERTSGPLDYYAHIPPQQQAAMRASAAYKAGQAVGGATAGVNAPPAPVSAYGTLGASGVVDLARCKNDRAGKPNIDECYALLPEKLRADMYAVDHTTFVHDHTVNVVILVREQKPAHQ